MIGLMLVTGVFIVLAVFSGDKAERIRIGYLDDSLTGALLVLADLQDFFNAEKINVDITTYSSGNESLQDLDSGRLDMAAIPLTTLVYGGFGGGQYKIVAILGSSENANRIIANKNIATIGDLKGKRIAAEEGTASHFFLDTVLRRKGMTMQDITFVDAPIAELPQMFERGDIDAFATRVLLARRTKSILENSVVLRDPGAIEMFSALVVSDATIRERKEDIYAVLRGLLAAENFSRSYSSQAITIVSRAGNFDNSFVFDLWQFLDLRVRLSERLSDLLEERARWMLQAGIVENKQVPAFSSFVDASFLREIKPDAVSF